MASSKDTFEQRSFMSYSFACGAFRGLGQDLPGGVNYRRPEEYLRPGEQGPRYLRNNPTSEGVYRKTDGSQSVYRRV